MLLVAVARVQAGDYWWMGTGAFGQGGNAGGQLEPQVIEVKQQQQAQVKQQQLNLVNNPFIVEETGKQGPPQPGCPPGQACQASCPLQRSRSYGGGIQERVSNVSMGRVCRESGAEDRIGRSGRSQCSGV